MSSHVIGTAGHIDHGKSTLVKRLTGIDPDRLKEEKEREMTIDLGFAHLTLPSGRRVSIVDVPGHEKFIRNMLAGATGIDLVLFVVAADEGMMPQSKEHLEILDLLGLKDGIVVVTKKDLVDDEWLELIIEDIKKELKGSFLENAPIVITSSKTGEGFDEIKKLLDEHFEKLEKRPVDAPVRFPIDRVFTMSGFGTVVTGTLWEGTVRVGDELVLLPQEKSVRVRNLQTHNQNVEKAAAGVRLAINLTGSEKREITRGDVLVEPGYFQPATLLDVKLRLLKDACNLKHADVVHFYLGTKETLGKIRLLYVKELKPGEETYAQVILEEPVIARRGDRFVIRRFSPLVTIGGGVVLNPYARRRRLQVAEHREELQVFERANDEEFIEFLLKNAGFKGVSVNEIKLLAALKEEKTKDILERLKQHGNAFNLGDKWFDAAVDKIGKSVILEVLQAYFKENPWASGMDREELRSRARVDDRRLYVKILESLSKEGKVVIEQDMIKLSGRQVELSPEEKKVRSRIEKAFLDEMFNPPLPEVVWEKSTGGKDVKLAKKLFNALVEEKVIIKVATDIYFHRKALERAQELVASFIKNNGSITVAQARDLLKTSRKYAVPLMEYFDKIKFTKRIGDERFLVNEK